MDKLIVDEIYVYIGNKQNRYYIFTALGFDAKGCKYPFYHLAKDKNYQDLYRFNQSLPLANIYHSDGALIYPQLYGQRSIAEKSAQTNLIESMNSQLRQYVSSIKRKTKCYAKSFDELNKKLAMVIINKIMV